MQALPPLPPPPPPQPAPPSAQGGSASDWCRAAVMEAQQPASSAASSSYPYQYQYANYSTYSYSQQTQTPQANGTGQGSTSTAPSAAQQPPPPPPPPVSQAAQDQAWAQYHQYQHMHFGYPYANPQGAYGAVNPQAASSAYQYGYPGYAYNYSYPPYVQPGYPQQQPQQQQQTTTTTSQQQQPKVNSTVPATSVTAASSASQPSVSTTVADPRVKPTAPPARRWSRFTAAKAQAAAPASDAMDIDEEGPATAQQKVAPAPPARATDDRVPLKRWLQRCLDKVQGDKGAEERLRPLLMAKVQDYASRGLIHTTDWDREPLIEVPLPSPKPSPRSASRWDTKERGATTTTTTKSRWDTNDRRRPRSDSGDERSDDEDSYYGPGKGGGGGARRDDRRQQQHGKGKESKKAKWVSEDLSAAPKQQPAKKGKPIAQYEHDEEANRRRAQRFRNEERKQPRRHKISAEPTYQDDGEGFDPSKVKPIQGRCQELEKEYFRLNEVPSPDVVRPEPVLRRALARLKRRFAETPVEERQADYEAYMWTQLKAIRQDLLVQHLWNDLVIDVYETHARIALECRDLNEYNQCQTQLMEHYRSGLQGSVYEFHAYRLLYYVYLQSNPKYQEGDMGMIRILAELTPQVSNGCKMMRWWSVADVISSSCSVMARALCRDGA